jgi:hypothetical protein
MGTMILSGIEFVDVCYPDYLVDHHTREGECLIGVPVSRTGRKPERSAEMFLQEIRGADFGVPEEILDGDLESAFLACIDGWRLNSGYAPVRRSQEVLNAWFVIRWVDADADTEFDPEREQQCYGVELTLDCLAEYREEWGDNF